MKTLLTLFTSSLIFSIILTPLSAQVDGSNTVNTTTANPVEGAFWYKKGDFGKACKEAYQTGKISSINLLARYVIIAYDQVMLGSFKDGEVADHNIGLREFPPGTIFVQEVATGKICLAQCANEMDVLRPAIGVKIVNTHTVDTFQVVLLDTVEIIKIDTIEKVQVKNNYIIDTLEVVTTIETVDTVEIPKVEHIFYQCWDVDTNGVADPSEDVNGDGFFDSRDCEQIVEIVKIDTFTQEKLVEKRIIDTVEIVQNPECWDLNGNGKRDDAEDINGDGYITNDDCGQVNVVHNTTTPPKKLAPKPIYTEKTQQIQYIEAASVPVGQSYFQEKVQANGYYKVITKTQNCNCVVY